MKRFLDPALGLLAFALVLSQTWELGYRVFSFETLLALGASLLLTIWSSTLASFHPAWRMACLGLLFALLVGRSLIPLEWLATASIVAMPVALAVLHKRVQPQFFIVFALVFAGAKYVKESQVEGYHQQASAEIHPADTQILVHWVMDELGSFESVPEPYRVKAEVDEISKAYTARGFRIHAGVPSATPETRDSLSSMVDLGAARPGSSNVHKVAGQNAFKVVRNPLHRLFVSEGWKVSITQSSYLDFCSDLAFGCDTYRIGRDSHLFDEAGLTLGERARIFERVLMAALYGQAEQAWRHATPTLPLKVMHEMDRLQDRIRLSTGRRYFFGHFLFPHFPWVVDKRCVVKPFSEWQLPYEARVNHIPGERAAALRAYWAQAYCAHHRILRMVDLLDAAFPGRVRYLIHGDHGPRILARTLPAAGDVALQVDERRNVLEPFVAARLETDVAPGRSSPDMQSLVQHLLGAEARVQTYGPAGKSAVPANSSP